MSKTRTCKACKCEVAYLLRVDLNKNTYYVDATGKRWVNSQCSKCHPTDMRQFNQATTLFGKKRRLCRIRGPGCLPILPKNRYFHCNKCIQNKTVDNYNLEGDFIYA